MTVPECHSGGQLQVVLPVFSMKASHGGTRSFVGVSLNPVLTSRYISAVLGFSHNLIIYIVPNSHWSLFD